MGVDQVSPNLQIDIVDLATMSVCLFCIMELRYVNNRGGPSTILFAVIQEKESMYQVMKAVDKANGYVFGKNEESSTLSSMMSTAVGADFDFFKTASIKEKYFTSDT